ncbi:uncharacterized protein MONOS_10478 [Monocercomonoides exilis]|uniref:uncharacterized protein n=1 Tax=Monocercomonoides exilis TaxID=2049356 RepID=UPI00355AACE5|nr:hypothetical protein MONOS_10478 [Monocercomonoides exilis]|eukprot:MONOS_10478.1-p1 / transcript=MONOS_10478.1 / gene=MONOS_10478 / organism=Monocercomonoides_exilis_PA203 / gene_product=unspecified product / transcript_product=unspecified product / location=Mono_scaffold00478:23955-27798(+) / protein_length=1176 / sequence_SO=supercontig / SO=protein_coding / is_pseudo=false
MSVKTPIPSTPSHQTEHKQTHFISSQYVPSDTIRTPGNFSQDNSPDRDRMVMDKMSSRLQQLENFVSVMKQSLDQKAEQLGLGKKKGHILLQETFLDDIMSELQDSKTELKHSNVMLEEEKGKVSALQEQLEQLKAETIEKGGQNAERLGRLSNLEKENAKMKGMLLDEEDIIKELKKQTEQLERDNNRLQREMKQIEQMKNQEIENERRKGSDLNQMVSFLRSELEKTRNQQRIREQEIAQKEKEEKERKRKQYMRISGKDIGEDEEVEDEEIIRLKLQYENALTEAKHQKESEISILQIEHEKEKRKADQEIQIMLQHIEEQKRKDEAIQKEREKERVDAENTVARIKKEHNVEMNALHEQIFDLTQRISEKEKREREYNKIEGQNSELQRMNSSLSQQLTEAQLELAKTKDKLEVLKAKEEEEREDGNKTIRELTVAQKELSKHSEKAKEEERRRIELEGVVKQIEKNYREAQAKVTSLEASCSHYKRTTDTLRQMVVEMENAKKGLTVKPRANFFGEEERKAEGLKQTGLSASKMDDVANEGREGNEHNDDDTDVADSSLTDDEEEELYELYGVSNRNEHYSQAQNAAANNKNQIKATELGEKTVKERKNSVRIQLPEKGKDDVSSQINGETKGIQSETSQKRFSQHVTFAPQPKTLKEQKELPSEPTSSETEAQFSGENAQSLSTKLPLITTKSQRMQQEQNDKRQISQFEGRARENLESSEKIVEKDALSKHHQTDNSSAGMKEEKEEEEEAGDDDDDDDVEELQSFLLDENFEMDHNTPPPTNFEDHKKETLKLEDLQVTQEMAHSDAVSNTAIYQASFQIQGNKNIQHPLNSQPGSMFSSFPSFSLSLTSNSGKVEAFQAQPIVSKGIQQTTEMQQQPLASVPLPSTLSSFSAKKMQPPLNSASASSTSSSSSGNSISTPQPPTYPQQQFDSPIAQSTDLIEAELSPSSSNSFELSPSPHRSALHPPSSQETSPHSRQRSPLSSQHSPTSSVENANAQPKGDKDRSEDFSRSSSSGQHGNRETFDDSFASTASSSLSFSPSPSSIRLHRLLRADYPTLITSSSAAALSSSLARLSSTHPLLQSIITSSQKGQASVPAPSSTLNTSSSNLSASSQYSQSTSAIQTPSQNFHGLSYTFTPTPPTQPPPHVSSPSEAIKRLRARYGSKTE